MPLIRGTLRRHHGTRISMVITRGRRGLSPRCPETPHCALARKPCYGRENISVSRPQNSDKLAAPVRQPAQSRKRQSQDTG